MALKAFSKCDAKVVVIGAGMSGLAATSQLIKHGFKNIEVLEAQDRIGGRMQTQKFGNSHIELGAQWIHGEVGNPVFEIAKKNNLLSDTHTEPINIFDSEFRTQHGELTISQMALEFGIALESILEECEKIAKAEAQVVNTAAENHYNSILDFFQQKYSESLKSKIDEPHLEAVKRSFLEWYFRFRNTVECCDSLAEMSIKSWSDYKSCDGNPNVNLKYGYLSVLDVVRENVPDEIIHLNTPVQSINIAEPVDGTLTSKSFPVSVICQNGKIIDAHHVISTVSLGYLKRHMNSYFNPELPESKKQAIEVLGFGTFNKIFLQFENPFWPKDFMGYSFLWVDESNPVIKEDAVKETMAKTWQKAIVGFYVATYEPDMLCGWIAGEEARYMESLSDSEVINTCVQLLKQFTGISSLPEVKKIVRSSWSSHEFVLGSYRYKTKECDKLKDVAEDLSAPLLTAGTREHPAVLFAGEATHPHYYSTVHGAYMSGIREADRLDAYYK